MGISLVQARFLLRRQKAPPFMAGMNGFLGRSSDLRRSVGTVQERSPAIYRGEYSLLRVLVAGIRFYQSYISCLFPSSCRYHPNCSTYFIESLNSSGIISGLFKGGWRILRCHPFSAGGYDPVNNKEDEDYEK